MNPNGRRYKWMGRRGRRTGRTGAMWGPGTGGTTHRAIHRLPRIMEATVHRLPRIMEATVHRLPRIMEATDIKFCLQVELVGSYCRIRSCGQNLVSYGKVEFVGSGMVECWAKKFFFSGAVDRL